MTGTTALRIVAALLVATVGVTGCATKETDMPPAVMEPDDFQGPPATVSVPPLPPLPEPYAQVDQYQAEDVMRAAVLAMFSWRPATDTSQRDAVVRARPLLDDRFVSRADQSFVALAPVTGKEWDRWAEAGATAQVSAVMTRDAHPMDQQASRARVWEVTVDVRDRAGTTIGTKKFAVYAVVTLMGVWRLSDLAVR